MNFNVVDGCYVDIAHIYADFEKDYLTTAIPNPELRVKYNLAHKQFRNLTRFIREKYDLRRRPRRAGKYYYPVKNGFIIQKKVGYKDVYIGFVHSEEVAIKIVEMCINESWHIEVCRDIVKNWREYVQ